MKIYESKPLSHVETGRGLPGRKWHAEVGGRLVTTQYDLVSPHEERNRVEALRQLAEALATQLETAEHAVSAYKTTMPPLPGASAAGFPVVRTKEEIAAGRFPGESLAGPAFPRPRTKEEVASGLHDALTLGPRIDEGRELEPDFRESDPRDRNQPLGDDPSRGARTAAAPFPDGFLAPDALERNRDTFGATAADERASGFNAEGRDGRTPPLPPPNTPLPPHDREITESNVPPATDPTPSFREAAIAKAEAEAKTENKRRKP